MGGCLGGRKDSPRRTPYRSYPVVHIPEPGSPVRVGRRRIRSGEGRAGPVLAGHAPDHRSRRGSGHPVELALNPESAVSRFLAGRKGYGAEVRSDAPEACGAAGRFRTSPGFELGGRGPGREAPAGSGGACEPGKFREPKNDRTASGVAKAKGGVRTLDRGERPGGRSSVQDRLRGGGGTAADRSRVARGGFHPDAPGDGRT